VSTLHTSLCKYVTGFKVKIEPLLVLSKLRSESLIWVDDCSLVPKEV
jgi:hypothetical protein